jgi:hypothetical protein
MADYEIREFREGDEESLLATFNEVFGAGRDDYEPRTQAQWDWAFRHNPAGRRVFVGLHSGRVVSQYAALPVRVWIDGRESAFAQIVDSMVHPDHRRGLKRPGLFVNTALPFFDEYGGPDKDLVHYGWPIENAWRMGKTFLHYEVVRTQNILAREPGEGSLEGPGEVVELERFDEQAKWLWDRCAGDFGASAIRDAAFLNWRFVDNPHHDYTVYGVRDDAGVLAGYAVYRSGDWVQPNMGLVADWLVPPDRPDVVELLHHGLLARARRDGVASIATVVVDWSPWFERLQDLDWLVWPSDYFMVARNFDRRFDMLWLRDHWWYTLADTDLV